MAGPMPFISVSSSMPAVLISILSWAAAGCHTPEKTTIRAIIKNDFSNLVSGVIGKLLFLWFQANAPPLKDYSGFSHKCINSSSIK
jgi:hypothetical protein